MKQSRVSKINDQRRLNQTVRTPLARRLANTEPLCRPMFLSRVGGRCPAFEPKISPMKFDGERWDAGWAAGEAAWLDGQPRPANDTSDDYDSAFFHAFCECEWKEPLDAAYMAGYEAGEENKRRICPYAHARLVEAWQDGWIVGACARANDYPTVN